MGFLISCTHSTTPLPVGISPSVTNTIFQSGTRLPQTQTYTQYPSSTSTIAPILPTQTLSPTISSTYIPPVSSDFNLKYQCLEIDPDFPPEAEVTGTLALRHRRDPPLLWNIETDEKIYFRSSETEKVWLHDSTPDGNWLAYETIISDKPAPEGKIISKTLFISNSDGEQYLSIPWEADWSYTAFWLDNEYLVIPLDGEPLKPVLIMNPFTGEREVYPPDYPDIISVDAPFDWGESSFTLSVFDPQRTRVVYPSRYEDLEKWSYVIWDIESQETIAEIPFPAQWSYPPRWSPGGEHFILANMEMENLLKQYYPNDPRPGDEFFLISRDGEVAQITNFVEKFDQSINIYHYRWSPDGRYIAFWLDTNEYTDAYEADGELAVLDIRTNQVTIYCIRGEFASGGGEPPVWAPNSQQLLVKSVNEEGESSVVLIDISQGYAVEIIKEYTPIGWIVTPP